MIFDSFTLTLFLTFLALRPKSPWSTTTLPGQYAIGVLFIFKESANIAEYEFKYYIDAYYAIFIFCSYGCPIVGL
jgi:hypothetical protein